jgi:hypothetical protein
MKVACIQVRRSYFRPHISLKARAFGKVRPSNRSQVPHAAAAIYADLQDSLPVEGGAYRARTIDGTRNSYVSLRGAHNTHTHLFRWMLCDLGEVTDPRGDMQTTGDLMTEHHWISFWWHDQISQGSLIRTPYNSAAWPCHAKRPRFEGLKYDLRTWI